MPRRRAGGVFVVGARDAGKDHHHPRTGYGRYSGPEEDNAAVQFHLTHVPLVLVSAGYPNDCVFGRHPSPKGEYSSGGESLKATGTNPIEDVCAVARWLGG